MNSPPSSEKPPAGSAPESTTGPNSSEPDEYELHRQEAERIERRAAAKEAVRVANIPSRHRWPRSGGQPRWGIALERVRGILGTGFLVALIGPRGTGKTQMAIEVVRHHVHNAKRPCPLYCTAMDIFIDLKASYGRQSDETERSVLDRYRNPDLLIIDEAHERGGTDWENRLLNALIDQRYRDVKDTILITNHESDQELEVSIGTSIYSRLVETGGVVLCDWNSFRGVQK